MGFPIWRQPGHPKYIQHKWKIISEGRHKQQLGQGLDTEQGKPSKGFLSSVEMKEDTSGKGDVLLVQIHGVRRWAHLSVRNRQKPDLSTFLEHVNAL